MNLYVERMERVLLFSNIDPFFADRCDIGNVQLLSLHREFDSAISKSIPIGNIRRVHPLYLVFLNELGFAQVEPLCVLRTNLA